MITFLTIIVMIIIIIIGYFIGYKVVYPENLIEELFSAIIGIGILGAIVFILLLLYYVAHQIIIGIVP